MSVFERYLTVWVLLCIVVGIGLGQAFPGAARTIGSWEVARVNLPVGLLIWVMIIRCCSRWTSPPWARCGTTCAASGSRCS